MLTQLTLPPQLHTQAFINYGALEYGLAITKQLRSVARLSHDANSTPGARRAENMANFEEMLRTELDRQTERRLVFAVAIKDTASPLHALGTDLLRFIGQQLWHPAILRWEDVMREYMETESRPLVL